MKALNATELKIKQMFFNENATIATIALTTGKTIAQVCTIINKLVANGHGKKG